MRVLLRVASALAGLALASSAPAQPPGSLDRELGFLEAEDVAKIPVTVASRGPAIPAGQAPAVVDVITAEEIRDSGARTLAELLEHRVGMDVAINRVVPRGLNTAPSQGTSLNNNRTLLLIDGRPTNGVFFGEFVAGRELPIDHIARIEIIRGAGSALYGTNAMAGVINVVTKSADETEEVTGLLEGGRFTTRRVELSAGGGGPNWTSNLFLHHFGSDGTNRVNQNDDQRNLYSQFRANYGPIRIEGEALSFTQEMPGTDDNPTPFDRLNRERYSLGASFVHPLGPSFQLSGQAYANLYQTRFLVVASDVDRRKYDDRRLGQELALHYRPSDWLSVTIGGEIREEKGKVGPLGCVEETADGLVSDPDGCELSQEVFAGYIEDQVTLPWQTILTAGVRYDRVTITDDERFSPRVNLLWQPNEKTWAKVGYGEAFRAPSFFELRGAQRLGSTAVIVGNPDLDAEIVRTVEGELAHRVSRAVNFRLGGFYTRGSDLITQQTAEQLIGIELDLLGPLFGDPLFEPILRRRFGFINSDKVTVAGLELGAGGVLDAHVAGELSYGVNYTFQETNNETLRDTDLPFAPRHKANLVLDYRPRVDVSIAWRMRWLDRQFASAFEEDPLQNYFDHDLNLIYRFSRTVELAVGAYNLLDSNRREQANVFREPLTVLASITVRTLSGPPLPDLAEPKREPAELADARAAIERARAVGADLFAVRPYKEALAHLEIAEELRRNGEDHARIVAAAALARAAADEARLEAMERPGRTPTPQIEATESPTPTPVRPERTPTEIPPATAAPAKTPASRGAPEVDATGIPAPAAPPPTSTPTLTPTVTPTPTPTPTRVPPTPTVEISKRRVLLLQSDAGVAIYRDTATSLADSLRAQVELHDLQGNRELGVQTLQREASSADLIVAVGSLAATLAQESVNDRPILFCSVLNPERYALDAANVAGVRFEVSAGAQLRRIHEALPSAKRIGILYDPGKSAPFVTEAERVAPRFGVTIVKAVVRDPRDVSLVFRSIRQDVDALWLIPDSTVVTRESFEVLALQSAESKTPLVAFAEAFARQGALLALYPDPAAVGGQCALLAERLLRGESRPSEIGIRDPERPLLAVNRRIEEQLGIPLGEGLEADVEIR